MKFLLAILITAGCAMTTVKPAATATDDGMKSYFKNRITYQTLLDYQAQIRTATVENP